MAKQHDFLFKIFRGNLSHYRYLLRITQRYRVITIRHCNIQPNPDLTFPTKIFPFLAGLPTFPYQPYIYCILPGYISSQNIHIVEITFSRNIKGKAAKIWLNLQIHIQFWGEFYTFVYYALKGIVLRKLRWVEIGIN